MTATVAQLIAEALRLIAANQAEAAKVRQAYGIQSK